VHGGRVRDTFGRLGRGDRQAPEDLARAVIAALREDEATSDLDLHVHVADQGLVELTGVVSDATVRRVAADVTRAVPGVEVVVNRIMLRGAAPIQPTSHPRPV
jgi:osmotically-inducible protein OsmY